MIGAAIAQWLKRLAPDAKVGGSILRDAPGGEEGGGRGEVEGRGQGSG